MIAVFSKYEKNFQHFRCTPKEVFIRIHDIRDILGKDFDGIIVLDDMTDEMYNAYEFLIATNPKLKKK